MKIHRPTRREFLALTGITTSGLMLGACLPDGKANHGDGVRPNLFVAIDPDGMVTLTCSRSEMGQGVRTGMPMILADELEADWSRVRIWQAPGDPEKYDPAGKDGQNTDGSRSTRHSFTAMRELGAAGRWVLEQARVAGVIIGARLGEAVHTADNLRLFSFALESLPSPGFASTDRRWRLRSIGPSSLK